MTWIYPLYLGQLVLLLTVVTGYIVMLRRLNTKTAAILTQAMDLTVKQQEIRLLIAKTVEEERKETAVAVRKIVVDEARSVAKLVVDEAAAVRTKVTEAQESAETEFADGAVHVHEKLDVLVAHGADDTNKKLDTLLNGKGPIKVEVVNIATEIAKKK